MRKKRHAECGTTPSGLAYTSLISQLRQHSYIATVGARSGLKRVLSAAHQQTRTIAKQRKVCWLILSSTKFVYEMLWDLEVYTYKHVCPGFSGRSGRL